MTYWPRKLAEPFHRARKCFPAVLVTGPRQSGKTTFLRHEAADCTYVTFDDPLQREFARQDPRGFLLQFGSRPVVLDEVQYVPGLFSYLKMAIDRNPELCGRYLMTGSQQFSMMKHISDSLAGRLAILELYPFCYRELRRAPESAAQTLWQGGYPPVCLQPQRREFWFRSYVQSYLERDVRQLQNVRDLALFETFLGLCAARHGGLLNRAEMAREAGVSQPTIRGWISVLQASYVAYLLHPYYRNIGKRLAKAPKFFFLDSGLIAWLTRQPDPESMWRGPLGGALFEGWVVSEAVKTFAAQGREPRVYFWRSHDGLEVDLLIEAGPRVHAVEVKQTATPRPPHVEGLMRWRAVAGADLIGETLLVCLVPEPVRISRDVTAIPWHQFGQWLESKLPSGDT